MDQTIAVNNVGYLPGEEKIAMTELNIADSTRFLVIEKESLAPVYEGLIQQSFSKDMETGHIVHIIDFSSLKSKGNYYVWVPEKNARSPLFAIHDTVYSGISRQAIHSFHFQKCGVEVGRNTPWYHPACHLDDAPHFKNSLSHTDVSGGWHDAGDYGKFSVTTAFSLGYILYLSEKNKDLFNHHPPFVLGNEKEATNLYQFVKWPMDWLLKMQRSDGGVYHKVQKKHWTGEYLPHEDPDERYIFDVSSTATANFAAVAALFARLLESYNPEYTQRLQEAALKSWQYLDQNPNIVPKGGFKNPAGVQGGAYSDAIDIDERLWAAVELYRLTNESRFSDYITAHYSGYSKYAHEPLTWKNVFPFAVASYLNSQIASGIDKIADEWLLELTTHTDKLLQQTNRLSYRTTLKPEEFYWGSNSVAAGYAFSLLTAWEQTGNINYKQLAADQLHYLLGRNTHNKVFITGSKGNFVQHPYHQLSMEINNNEPVYGFMVGGPNAYHQRSTKGEPESPAKWYRDNEKNYPSNEVAINYTASFVYLAGYFSSAKYLNQTIQ